jgi:hypothetical protein
MSGLQIDQETTCRCPLLMVRELVCLESGVLDCVEGGEGGTKRTSEVGVLEV